MYTNNWFGYNKILDSESYITTCFASYIIYVYLLIYNIFHHIQQILIHIRKFSGHIFSFYLGSNDLNRIREDKIKNDQSVEHSKFTHLGFFS